jgi:hypothetical protein
MEAFGLTPDELWLVSRENPGRLMGLESRRAVSA